MRDRCAEIFKFTSLLDGLEDENDRKTKKFKEIDDEDLKDRCTKLPSSSIPHSQCSPCVGRHHCRLHRSYHHRCAISRSLRYTMVEKEHSDILEVSLYCGDFRNTRFLEYMSWFINTPHQKVMRRDDVACPCVPV